jgi:hypothetical protein
MIPTSDPSPDDLIPDEPPAEAFMPADEEEPREALPYEMRTGEERDGPPKPRPDVSAAVLGFFGPESPLRRAPEVGGRPYEERPQQLAMAQAICESWHAGEHLCVEAPTGVGKSFAYLLPAIHWSLLTGRPVVVSTHTIALQEQLIHKDIPILQQLVGHTFTAALAKGRQNYVCRHRLEKAAGGDQEYLPMESLLPEVALKVMRIGRFSCQPGKPWGRLIAVICRSPLELPPPPPLHPSGSRTSRARSGQARRRGAQERRAWVIGGVSLRGAWIIAGTKCRARTGRATGRSAGGRSS